MKPTVLCCLVALLASCSVEPRLLLYNNPDLVIGEKGSVILTYGSDGSELKGDTLSLTDAEGGVYDATNPVLGMSQVLPKHVEFVIPPGISPGDTQVSLATKKGPVFQGTFKVNRIIIVRDQAGKVWYLNLQGLSGGATAFQFLDFGQTPIASELGQVAISPSGRFIAVSSRRAREVRLATVERVPRVTNPVSFVSEVLNLSFLPNEDLLVITAGGIYRVEKPSTRIDNSLLPSATLWLNETAAQLAISRTGQRGAILRVPTSAAEGYTVVPVDLTGPSTQTPIPLPWVYSAKAISDLLVSPDDSTVLAVNSEVDKVTRINLSDGTLTEEPLPPGQQGPAAITGTRDGSLYYVANEKSRNISMATLQEGQLMFATTALDLDLSSESGAVVQMAMSDHDEAALLFEHDLFLLWGADNVNKAMRLQFPDLFRDKQTGEVGASVAIQP